MAPVAFKALPPAEAIAYFRQKGLQESFAWQDVWQEEHAKAFTVAKAMRQDILADIRAAFDQALAGGGTLERFTADLRPLLQAKGWWGKAILEDPVTGEDQLVQLGSPHRLRTIFDTNMRTAYSAGRWQRIQATKQAFPYLRYNHTPQEHPREEHQAWGAQPVILPVDDPWWDTHFTPNGFFCKCYETQLNDRMLQRDDLEVTKTPVAFPIRQYKNPRTGEVIAIEGGVYPGFNYNAGKAYFDAVTPRLVAPTAPVPPLTAPAPIAPRPGPGLAGLAAEEAVAGFLARFGPVSSRARVITDVIGEPLVIGPALFRTASGEAAAMTDAQIRAMPMAGEALRAPAEVRWIWRKAADGRLLLVRRYIARLESDGEIIDVVVEIAGAGQATRWSVASSLDGDFDLDAWRGGHLAWPPQE